MSHLSRVAVWNDPSCSITYFDTKDMERYGYSSEDDFIVWYTDRLKQGALAGFDYSLIDSSGVPADRSDRDCWKLSNGVVSVDQVKLNKKSDSDAKKQAVLSKLKITANELKDLLSTNG